MKHHQTNVMVSKLRRASRQAKLWARLADELESPTRRTRRVNLDRLASYAGTDRTLVVPGKVLATGTIDKPVTVAAFGFSEEARAKIEGAKGKTMDIETLLAQNPKANQVRIIG